MADTRTHEATRDTRRRDSIFDGDTRRGPQGDMGEGSFGQTMRGDSHLDRHYRDWRGRQIAELDRDYEDYRLERQQRFESDFDRWRETRRTPPQQSGGVTPDSGNSLSASMASTGSGRPEPAAKRSRQAPSGQ